MPTNTKAIEAADATQQFTATQGGTGWRQSKESDRLAEIIDAAARQALKEGIEISDQHGGAVHLWVMRNVHYRPETEFYVVFLVSGQMADIQAQEAGYKNAADRAASLAVIAMRGKGKSK